MKPEGSPNLRDFSGRRTGRRFSGLRREPVAGGRGIASSEAVIDALRTVYDPEIPLNIYDLGLIYRLDVADDGAFRST